MDVVINEIPGVDNGPTSITFTPIEQMQQVKKMGPLGSIMEMIPGLGHDVWSDEIRSFIHERIDALTQR